MTAFQKTVLLIIGVILLVLAILSYFNAEKIVERMVEEGRIQEAAEYIANTLSGTNQIKACHMLADYYDKAGNEVEAKRFLGEAIFFYVNENYSYIANGSGTNEYINYLRQIKSEYGYTGAELYEALCLGGAYTRSRPVETKDTHSSGMSDKDLLSDIHDILTVPLLINMRHAEPENVQFMIENFIRINTKNKKGFSPLMAALHNEQEKTARLLIEAGATVNDKNDRGWTPLMFAVKRRIPEMVKLLLEAGAKVNVDYDLGGTPPMVTLSHGRQAIARMLIKAGADVNAKDNQRRTPLMFASHKNVQTETVKLLIETGAEINARNELGVTPLIYALYYNRPKCAKELIQAAADVNARNIKNDTPLMLALEKNVQIETVRLLVEAGADVNTPEDEEYWTPLMCACRYADLSAVKLLLSNGAKVNTKNIGGQTPLHLTIYRNNDDDMAEIITVLKQAGADISNRNNEGNTPYEIAKDKNKSQAILDLLK